jgi:exonuclease SbcC
MLITRIELQNTKSYRDQTVIFAEGTNAICGENGAGKSTLLEAIGFVLFDFLSNTQTNFVREGERTATISVHFVSSADGREYQVVRRCGGSSDYYVYDPELRARLVAGKADVLDWLTEHLRVETTEHLPVLFRDAVGVPQGLLTAAFLQSPGARKSAFDKLLRVDEYDRAYKELRETQTYLKDEIAAGKARIAGLEAQVARLPGLCEQADSVRADIAGIVVRLADLRTALAEATARREALETAKRELDHLAQEVGQKDTRLQGIAEQLSGARQAVGQAQAAQTALESSRPGYQAYQAAKGQLDRMEGERQQRDRWKEKQGRQERALALAQADITRLQTDLLAAQQAAAQMTALTPRIERQTQVENAIRVMREQVQALRTTQTQVDECRLNLEEARARLSAVEAGLAAVARAEAELRQAQMQLDEVRRARLPLMSQQAATQADTERLTKQMQALEATEMANCPVCEQPLTAQHKDELLQRNRAQLAQLSARSRALSQEVSTADKKEQELSAHSASLESQLRRLPRATEREELNSRIGELESRLSELQAQSDALAGVRERLHSLELELAEMGDPRREHDRLAAQAGRRTEVEKKLQVQQQALAGLEASLAEIEQALHPFADLDTRMEAQRRSMAQYEAAYHEYLQNARIAAELPARQQQVETLTAQQAALTQEMEALRARQQQAAARFDAAELAEAVRREGALKSEQANLEGRQSIQQRRIRDIEQEIEQLTAAQRALAEEQSAIAEREDLQSTVAFFRDIIRSAGPHVIRRLAQRVSLKATHMFGAIMADHTARLHWQEDYGIVLETNGRQREFEQLSGGEQMAAALSVRLALLRELSAIDVAFFDEPTSNLDDTRRDNLAEQILSVRNTGFSQLFVISHDDTFEQVTNHIVRVRKEQGESLVEVG